ncbi:hypothetical protein PR048_019985 [Dryococelus australis]|uniref:Uncharacterized protein n=1 Tax=Dryococelus australis TaxID=614101 RepID=A0ABQ9H508_9NEOP|nr:hypothetical protein PR048_019985 [Dryococelus australis]
MYHNGTAGAQQLGHLPLEGEGSILDEIDPGFSHAGIVANDAACRRAGRLVAPPEPRDSDGQSTTSLAPSGSYPLLSLLRFLFSYLLLPARMGCTHAPVLLFHSRSSWKFNTIPDDIEPTGLFVDPDLSWLTTTPYGLIGNDTLVAVKYPLTARNLTPQEAEKEKKLTYCILKDDHLYLNENHPYRYKRWNAREGETGEPREIRPASGIVGPDSHNVKIRERPHHESECRIMGIAKAKVYGVGWRTRPQPAHSPPATLSNHSTILVGTIATVRRPGRCGRYPFCSVQTTTLVGATTIVAMLVGTVCQGSMPCWIFIPPTYQEIILVKIT